MRIPTVGKQVTLFVTTVIRQSQSQNPALMTIGHTHTVAVAHRIPLSSVRSGKYKRVPNTLIVFAVNGVMTTINMIVEVVLNMRGNC